MFALFETDLTAPALVIYNQFCRSTIHEKHRTGILTSDYAGEKEQN